MSVDLTRKLFKFHKGKKIDKENQRRVIIALKTMMKVFASEAGVSPEPDDYRVLLGICKSVHRKLGYGDKVNAERIDRDAIIPIDGIFASDARFMFGISEENWRRYILLEEHKRDAVRLMNDYPEHGFEIDKDIDIQEKDKIFKNLKKSIINWEHYYDVNSPEFRIIAEIRKYYGLAFVSDVNEYMKYIDKRTIRSLSKDQIKNLRKHIDRIDKLIAEMK